MNSILTLLRLDIRTKFGFGQKITRKSIASFLINLFFSAVIYAVFLIGAYYITQIMVTGSVPMRYEFLVIATGISIVVQTIACTGVLVKHLYYDGENEILLRFPVDGKQIFFAKALYAFIYNAVVAYGLTLPVYMMYGAATAAGAGFYLIAVPLILLISLLPFCLANLIALPVINLTNFLKNRFALILSLLIIVVVFGFAFYMLVLKGFLAYAENKSPVMLTEATRDRIHALAAGLFPFNLYGNVLYGTRSGLSMVYIVLLTAALMAVAYFVAKKTVYPIVTKSIERQAEAFTLKTKETVRPVFRALLRKEYILIFRSLNYSFQYLCMAITAPVMVYFCNDLASSIGDAGVGGRIIPGLTLLVVIIFITIIVSFASTAVSREGNTFYLTKIMPVSYKFQILVKLMLYFVVATGSVLVSCIVVGAAFSGEKYGNHVGITDILSIFAIAEMLILALTASAMKTDLKSPTFEVSKSGELTNGSKNVSTNLLLGCGLAVVYGLVTMIFSYVPLRLGGVTFIKNTSGAYVILSILSAILAAAELLTLFLPLNKRYNKIKAE